jgi:peptidoglycan-associated lipoprotein
LCANLPGPDYILRAKAKETSPMNFRHALFSAAAAAASAFLAACSTAPPATAPSTTTSAAPAPAPMPTPAAPKPAAGANVATAALPAYLDPQNPLSRDRSIYFAFDDYAVSTEYAPLIERHGQFLAQHPTVAIRIEGNSDERGSAEYNLSLGQRRAEAVLRALKIYGVKESQMEAVSYGEEKPKAVGHDESAWSQNRRADLAYPSK